MCTCASVVSVSVSYPRSALSAWTSIAQATEAFVDSLSQKASVELLDLILKKRGESSSDTEDDIFVTGGAKIRLEDYQKLDANGDGLISRSSPSPNLHRPHPRVLPTAYLRMAS